MGWPNKGMIKKYFKEQNNNQKKKLSMLWFSEKERAIATSLGSMSNLLGIAISYVISPVIVPGDNPNESIDLFID